LPAYPWQELIILSIAGLLGILAELPRLQEAGRARFGELRLPPALIALALFAQAAVIYLLALAFGLLPAAQLGVGALWLRAWLGGNALPAGWPTTAGLVLAGGFLLGLLLAWLARISFPKVDERLREVEARSPAWKGLLSALSTLPEEVSLRLFLCTLTVWLLGWFWQDAAGAPAQGAWLVGISLAAYGSGLNQLLTAGLRLSMSAALIARVLLPQMAAGWFFGWVYWQFGLEAAALAHLGFEAAWFVLTRLTAPRAAAG